MLFKKQNNAIDWKWRWIGLSGKLFIDVLFAGCRIQVRGRQPIESVLESGQFIFAFWHSRILLVSYLHKGWNAAILVSNSADGEIIAQILKRQGHATIRGSTGKGGLRALSQMATDMRLNRRPAGVVPDGPQGPRHKVQPGVILLARKTGYPIIPVTYSAKRHKRVNSWDRFMIPCPISPCLLIYGRPIRVAPDSDSEQIQGSAIALENELNRITGEADHYFGHSFEPCASDSHAAIRL